MGASIPETLIWRQILSGNRVLACPFRPFIIDSSKGAVAGAVVGTAACTQSVVLAPRAPICAVVGALVGGVTGFVFGSSG